MSEQVITSLEYKKSWDSKYGDNDGKMHTWNIAFDNGESGEVNTKFDKAPYAVGDTVEIKDKKSTEYGNKYKVGLVKADLSTATKVPNQTFPNGTKQQQMASFAPPTNGARVGMIINNACQSLTALKTPLTCKAILEVAEQIEKATLVLEKGEAPPSNPTASETPSASPEASEKQKVVDAGLDAVEETDNNVPF